MSCPYCQHEINALEAINTELVKMLGAFVGGSIQFKTVVAPPADEKQYADMLHCVSKATAAAAIRRLEEQVTSRAELHKELAMLKLGPALAFGPPRHK